MLLEVLRPAWDCHPRVQGLVTTRRGGVSKGAYAELNLGDHVGDDPLAVAENRARLESASAPCFWIDQVHGASVVEAHARDRGRTPVADALWTREAGLAIGVLTADCFPLMLTDRQGTLIGLAHCGWRPLRQGVIARLIQSMPAETGDLIVWICPGISMRNYEVGDDFVREMHGLDAGGLMDGVLCEQDGRTYADLARLIRNQLAHLGVDCPPEEPACTFADTRFFSHRRDGPDTGRFASILWIDAS